MGSPSRGGAAAALPSATFEDSGHSALATCSQTNGGGEGGVNQRRSCLPHPTGPSGPEYQSLHF